MPLYFLDVYDGETIVRDQYGAEFESGEEAAEQAAALLPDLARDALPDRDSHDFAALVRDEDETVVYRAALLFRGQRMGAHELRAAPRPPPADDLILRSRETRAAAGQVAIRLQESVRDLLTLVQAVSRTAEGIRKEREARV